MNQVAPFEGKPLAKSNLQNRLQRFRQTRPRSSDGSIYLKMAKDGEWSYGAEEEVPEEDSKWACDPNSIGQGYICWPIKEEDRGGGPLDEVMYEAGADVPLMADMPHREGGGWSDQLSIGMKCISGEDKDLEVVYKTNSKSGVRELNALIDEILGQIEAGEDTVIPVVLLRNDNYKHKKYGKIYTPVLEIVDWLDGSGAAAEAEPEEEAPKTRRRAKAAEPESEPEVEAEPEEEEAPKTRRRAKAAEAEEPEVEEAEEEPAEEPAPRRRRRRT